MSEEKRMIHAVSDTNQSRTYSLWPFYISKVPTKVNESLITVYSFSMILPGGTLQLNWVTRV